MPTPDFIDRALRRHLRKHGGLANAYMAAIQATNERRKRKRRDKDDGGVPVEPERPLNLSGGAAAPLEFEGD